MQVSVGVKSIPESVPGTHVLPPALNGEGGHFILWEQIINNRKHLLKQTPDLLVVFSVATKKKKNTYKATTGLHNTMLARLNP